MFSLQLLGNLPWPMALTISRLLLVPVFLILSICAAPGSRNSDDLRYAALGVFALMAVTDTLDGCLARTLNQVSKLGTFLDPLATAWAAFGYSSNDHDNCAAAKRRDQHVSPTTTVNPA